MSLRGMHLIDHVRLLRSEQETDTQDADIKTGNCDLCSYVLRSSDDSMSNTRAPTLNNRTPPSLNSLDYREST